MKREGVDHLIETETIGYVIDIPLSQEILDGVGHIQQQFVKVFGDAVFCPTLEQLHITVLDFLAPFAEYGEDKDVLFQRDVAMYRSAFLKSISGVAPFSFSFNQLQVFNPCVIAKGKQPEGLRHVRETFLEQEVLAPQTKKPPDFVHSTIIAFRKVVDLDLAEDIVRANFIDTSQTVTHFRLVRESKVRHQAFEVLETFDL